MLAVYKVNLERSPYSLLDTISILNSCLLFLCTRQQEYIRHLAMYSQYCFSYLFVLPRINSPLFLANKFGELYLFNIQLFQTGSYQWVVKR